MNRTDLRGHAEIDCAGPCCRRTWQLNPFPSLTAKAAARIDLLAKALTMATESAHTCDCPGCCQAADRARLATLLRDAIRQEAGQLS